MRERSSHLKICLDLGGLGLGRSSLLAAALLVLNNGHGLRHELNAPVAAVGASVQLAVVVQVVLTVELILSAEFTAEPIWALCMETVLLLAFS